MEYSYDMTVETRQIYCGRTKKDRAELKRVYVYMTWADSETLTFVIRSDQSRRVLTVTWSQERQSGIISTDHEDYRHVVAVDVKAGDGEGWFFSVKTTKTVPSTGDVKYYGVQLDADDSALSHEPEFSTTYSSGTDPTFVVEADADTEEDAYA